MQTIFTDFQDQDVMVLSIGAGENVDACAYWQYKYQQTCPVLADTNSAIYSLFGDGYVPYNVILDDTMKVQHTNSGFSANQIRTKLTTYSTPLVKILHDPMPNTENTSSAYTVSCDITSGGNLIPASLKLFWNTNGGGSFTQVVLTAAGGDTYTGSIPAQSAGTTVYYYLHGEADNGKQRNEPMDAPDSLHAFDVLIDTAGPVITHEPLTRWRADMWSPTFVAQVVDQIGVGTVTMVYKHNTCPQESAVMTLGEDGLYTATLDCPGNVGDTVLYWFEAVDTSIAANTSRLPETGSYTLTAVAPLPALIIDLDGNTNSGPVINSQLQSLGIASEYVTQIPDFPALYSSVWICLGVAPNNHVMGFIESQIFYEYLTDGGYVYMEGGNCWANDTRFPFMLEFSIGNTGTGSGNVATVNGLAGTMTDGLTFQYTGDNQNMDNIRAKTGATLVLENVSPQFGVAVAKEDNSYKTIGSSIELGGLSDSSLSTKAELLTAYATFFDLMGASPTPTPVPPTPTPSACSQLGVTISMPSHLFNTGDTCSCTAEVCNPGPDTYTQVPLFIVLDVYGSYFFYPSFGAFDQTFIDLPVGSQTIPVLPGFQWPAGTGAAEHIWWYAAMTDANVTTLFGALGSWEFGWAE